MESAKNILARIYRESREPKEQDEQIVCSFWAPTVGARIAGLTQPIRLYRGRLVVDVEGHDWRRQLAAMSREITMKLNAALGKKVLEGIDFRVKVPASAVEEMDEINAGSARNRTRQTPRKRRQA